MKLAVNKSETHAMLIAENSDEVSLLDWLYNKSIVFGMYKAVDSTSELVRQHPTFKKGYLISVVSNYVPKQDVGLFNVTK